MRIFTKIDGKLVCWETNTESHEIAIQLVRDELGATHKSPILALVKY